MFSQVSCFPVFLLHNSFFVDTNHTSLKNHYQIGKSELQKYLQVFLFCNINACFQLLWLPNSPFCLRVCDCLVALLSIINSPPTAIPVNEKPGIFHEGISFFAFPSIPGPQSCVWSLLHIQYLWLTSYGKQSSSYTFWVKHHRWHKTSKWESIYPSTKD